MTQEEYSAVCPYLGLADDADSHATYATEAHRCYRLPNPTRIATPHQEKHCLGANHVTCPVYLGEGVPQPRPEPAAAAAAAPPVAAAPSASPFGRAQEQEAPVRGPRPGQRPRAQSEQRPRRPANAGTLGPRPRSGGISIPVMTVGLFALAIVVVGLAIAIQNLVDDGGGGGISPSDTVATAAAFDKTRTAQAGGQATNPPQTQTTQQPGTQTGTAASPTGTRTPGTGTPSSGRTYVVKAGDFCGTIATDHNVTLAALLQANNMTEADCNTLQIGRELKIP